MTLDVIALVVSTALSVLVPLVVLGICLKRSKGQRKSIGILFVVGILIYLVMQWGVKEHSLVWLFNNTKFTTFMNEHYIPYLLVVAFAGSVLTVLSMFAVNKVLKGKLTFAGTVSLALGFTITESVMVVGIRCVNTLIQLYQGTDMQLGTTTAELFLSGYERVLLMLIDIALLTMLTYFVHNKMSLVGILVATFVDTLVSFLPGFFIAFSLADYLELYDRSVALIMVYVLLTATAITGMVVVNALKSKFEEIK